MKSNKLIKIIAVITIASMCLSGCQKKRDIARSPKPIDYTVETPEIKNMDQMPEINDDTHDYNLSSADLSKADLSGQYGKLMMSTFDTKTVFPKNIPDAFNPKEILEKGRKEMLSCGVKEAHDMGYTGKGVSVAVIDGPILTEHEDYKNELVYYREAKRITKNDTAKMHGTAICSIFVGKNGVAPDADLYYIADDLLAFEKDNSVLAEDIHKIIDLNKTLPKEKKIRIISISIGGENEKTPGYKEYINALKDAHAAGIFVMSTTVGDGRADLGNTKIQYMGLSKIGGKTGLKSYKYAAWTDKGSDDDLKDNAEWYQTQLCVPMDNTTTASPTGNSDYVYYCLCGMSWATPFLSGAYALACQADPEITFEKFYDIAMKTADSTTNEDMDRTYKLSHVINVKNMIEEVKNEKKNK